MKKFAFLILITVFSVSFAAAQESGLKGKIRNQKGDGISGASVIARQDGKDVKSSKSDSKGNFELTGLKSGVYNLLIDKSGYSSGLLSDVEVKDSKVRDLGDRLILTVDRELRLLSKEVFLTRTAEASAAQKSKLKEL